MYFLKMLTPLGEHPRHGILVFSNTCILSKCWPPGGSTQGTEYLFSLNNEYKSKQSIKFVTNRVHMARHGLILSQDGAIPSRIVFIRVLGPYNTIFNYFKPKKKVFPQYYPCIFLYIPIGLDTENIGLHTALPPQDFLVSLNIFY